MSDSQLNWESKTETSVEKAQNYIWGGDTAQKKCELGGGTPHILPEQCDKRGGHRTSKFGHMLILGWGHRTQFQTLAVGRVGGRDLLRIMPLRGSILQDRTCNILS